METKIKNTKVSALKKYPIEIEAERILNALKQKNKPVITALKDFDTATAKRIEGGFVHKLPTLIGHLTKISKRKTLTGKHQDKKIGLNCNGLGHEVQWGSQLNNLCDNRHADIETLWGIITDDDLNLEIQQEIVSSNRTNFMKLVNKMKQTSMPREDDIKSIKIGGEIDIVFRGNKTPMLMTSDEEVDYKLIDENNFCELREDGIFEFKTLIDAEILMENIPEIVTALKEAKKQVEQKTKDEADLSKFVTNMLNVFEAMENI